MIPCRFYVNHYPTAVFQSHRGVNEVFCSYLPLASYSRIQHNGGNSLGVSTEFRWWREEDILIMGLSNNIEWGFTMDKIRKKLARIVVP